MNERGLEEDIESNSLSSYRPRSTFARVCWPSRGDSWWPWSAAGRTLSALASRAAAVAEAEVVRDSRAASEYFPLPGREDSQDPRREIQFKFNCYETEEKPRETQSRHSPANGGGLGRRACDFDKGRR